MNMWIVTGIVVFKGQKRNERAPWPCIIESDGGPKEDPATRIPVDIFGDVEVGQCRAFRSSRQSRMERKKLLATCRKTSQDRRRTAREKADSPIFGRRSAAEPQLPSDA